MEQIYLCDYGCGKFAIKKFKNGVVCCSNHYSHCPVIKNKMKQTCMERYGAETTVQSKSIQNKIKKTISEHTLEQKSIIKEKRRSTCLEKYGVDDSNKSEQTKEKFRKTCLEHYGVENPAKVKEIRERIKQTCLEKYGVEYSGQSEETRQKSKQTCLEKYGVEYYWQSEQMKKFSLEKYGTLSPNQNPEILKKQNKYKRKSYIFPSGKEVFVQGYEPFALDILINDQNILEEDLFVNVSNIPKIKYIHNLKERVYFPDIYIKSQNKLIEVKSIWTLKKYFEQNMSKKQATQDSGFLYEIWVIGSDGKILEIL